MKIEFSRDTARWLYEECFPLMIEMSVVNVKIHSNKDVEYWNSKIIMYTLRQVREKIRRRLLGKSNNFKIDFEDAEGYTLYRFLFNYPIEESAFWKVSQRQYLVNQLHKQMNEP